MSTTAICERCGAEGARGKPCPVCDHVVGEAVPVELHEREATDEGLPKNTFARWWHTGQLGLGVAALLFVGALFLPLVGGLELRSARGEVSFDQWVRPLDILLGTYSARLGQMTAWMLPGAALFFAQILRSRKGGSAMMAARPLVLVVSLAPLVSLAMPFLKLRRNGVEARPGAAVVLVLMGVVLGVVSALRFGRDVPELKKKSVRQSLADEDDRA